MASVVTIADLPHNALDAAQLFMTEHIEAIRTRLSAGADMVIVMPLAGKDHTDWRRAAVRDLARSYAPARANMTTAGNAEALESVIAYLVEAGAVTGQYLPLD